MVELLQNVHYAAILLLVICSFVYWRHLRKIKRQRKLSKSEFIMYILTQVAYLLWAGSALLLLLGT